MKIRLWTLMFPVSLTIFPGTPLEEMFGPSYRPLSQTDESSFLYGQLTVNAHGHSAATPNWIPPPTYEGFPADNSGVTSQYSNELYQPVDNPPNQAGHRPDRNTPLASTLGEESLHADTGKRRLEFTNTENGPLIAPEAWTYGQHFESYASPMEHHFDTYALPMEHHTSHEFVNNLPQHDILPFSHIDNPIIDDFLEDHLLNINPESFSNLLAFSPEFDSNQAQPINLGETETSEGLTNAQDVPLDTGGKRKTHEPPAHFEHTDYSTLEYYNQIAKFLQDDHRETSHQFTSDPVELISENEAIQVHSKDMENIDISKKMRSPHNLFYEQIISPESMNVLQYLRVVEFKPFSIDGEVMIEAINGLKLPNGRKFVNHFFKQIESAKQMMIMEDPSRDKAHQLCSKYQELCRADPVQIPRAAQDESTNSATNTARLTLTRAQKLKKVSQEWKTFFNPEFNSRKKSKIEEYKKFVMEDIDQQNLTKLQKKIKRRFAKSQQEMQTRLKYLTRVERILPAFFFYVDLITAIFPNEDLKNGALLKTTRQNAGKLILELLEEKLAKPKTARSDSELLDDSLENEAAMQIFSMVGKRINNGLARETSFNWKLLYYWMLKSRKDLIYDHGVPDKQSNEFKGFFNDCFLSWIEYSIIIG